MKKVCALTMVRNDDFFLKRWVDYYSAQLGAANLYVYFDGEDQKVPEFCKDVNVCVRPRVAGLVAAADRGRIDFLSSQAAELLTRYDMAIGTDVDEFLVVDPAIGKSLVEFLSSQPDRVSYSGLGVDVGQHLEKEDEIVDGKTFLEQRHFAQLSTRYSKSTVITRPVAWGSGFHRVRNKNFHIVKYLYLFHFGCVDMKRLEAKFVDPDKVATGWSRHLKKRAKTIFNVTEGKERAWDKWVKAARFIQNYVRPVYAWNKPAMLNMKIIVRIPERFSKII